jgi:hypothetical protein
VEKGGGLAMLYNAVAWRFKHVTGWYAGEGAGVIQLKG